MPEPIPADIILTWIGAAGVVAYLRHIHGQRTRSLLERRTLFLLYCLAVLLALRGFYWLLDHVILGVLIFVPATLLPLALALFVEGLLRRHLRLGPKIYIAAGTSVFLILDLLTILPTSATMLAAFGLFVISVMGYLGLVLFRRDYSDLSEAENRFANVVAVAFALAIPLVATDFREGMWSWAPLRLGSIGALVFVYVCVRASTRADSKRAVFGELLGILAGSALVALPFIAISGEPWPMEPAYFAVAGALTLLFAIIARLRSLRLQNERSSFIRTLLEADSSRPDRLIASLRKLPFMEERFIIEGEDLKRYDEAALINKLDAEGRLCRLSSLREALARGDVDSVDATEQLVDLLERYRMSHVCLIQRLPPMLLLVSLPQVAGGYLTELELALVGKCARLSEKQDSV